MTFTSEFCKPKNHKHSRTAIIDCQEKDAMADEYEKK